MTVNHDPEANVAYWELSKAPIDYAKEVGNVIIHFNNNGTPVLIEVLEATKFVGKIEKLIKPEKARESVASSVG